MELQFKGHTIYLDEEDRHYLEKIRFNILKGENTYYLHNAYKRIRFHRLIMNCPEGKEVDHINGIGLDNRKCNLRICSHSQNMQNGNKRKNTSSKYKGVTWYKRDEKWMTQIWINGKRKYLGLFVTEQEAAKAYNQAALKHFGQYANINQFD